MTRNGSIHQEDITIISICAANLRAPKYTKQTLTELKGTDSNTVLVGDFNSPLSIMNAMRQKMKRNTDNLNKSTDQQHLTHREHLTKAENIRSSQVHMVRSPR